LVAYFNINIIYHRHFPRRPEEIPDSSVALLELRSEDAVVSDTRGHSDNAETLCAFRKSFFQPSPPETPKYFVAFNLPSTMFQVRYLVRFSFLKYFVGSFNT
jgi:hypothetical protein